MARALGAVLVTAATVAAVTEPADARQAPARVRPPGNVFPVVDPIDEARTAHDYGVALLYAYIDDLLADVEVYVRSVINEERATALAAARAAEIVRGATSGSLPAGNGRAAGDCYAGPVPAYIVNRESGGDPNAVNPSSGAYGCFQIIPSTWNSSCSDLARDVAGQIACADRISNGGTNLQPWATTR